MNNWWLAVLEHFGLLTREEAEHLGDSIKFSVGSDNYKEAYEIVGSLIRKGEFAERTTLKDLQTMITANDAKIKTLEALVKEDKSAPLIAVLQEVKSELTNLQSLVKDKKKETIAKPIKTM